MKDDLLPILQMLNPAVLTRVVRQDLACDDFEITSWSVERLSGKGMTNPDGLWLFHGTGGDQRGQRLFRGLGPDERGERPWSVVLNSQPPEKEQPPSDLWYWKREVLVAQFGLSTRLPGPVKAPRFYRLDGQPESWLWMEHIHDAQPGPWPLANSGLPRVSWALEWGAGAGWAAAGRALARPPALSRLAPPLAPDPGSAHSAIPAAAAARFG